MIMIALLFPCMLHLQLTNAAGRIGMNTTAQEPVERFNIKQGHRVFLHAPGDIVYVGKLERIGMRPLPAWMFEPSGLLPNNMTKRVYVRSPRTEGLFADLQLLHNNDDPRVQTRRCFVVTGNNVVLAADLHYWNFKLMIFRTTRIYVRIPGDNHNVYTGILHIEENRVPSWLQ